MAIKPDADKSHFLANPQERELAVRLDEAFDATHGARHGQLSLWLLQPTTRTKERFGIQKEVLTIYSPHAVTDARVLTAIDQISRGPDFRNRVEKVVFLVVHRGESDETEALVRSDKERVIIPFTATEILDPARGPLFVRAKISEVIGTIDLFGMSSPMTSDRYFFGRTELVQQLSRKAAVQRQNAGLFGLRKTGKTSVLFAVRRVLEQQAVLTEYFDCQNPGIHNARWWQVLGNIVTGLQETLKRTKGRTIEIKAPYRRESAGTAFSSDIKILLSAGNYDQVLIILDEIEWITPGISGALGQHWDDDFIPFWQTVRATHQETEGRLTFLLAGVNPVSVQRSHFGALPNPIFQLAIPHYLEPFTDDSVREMVRTIGRYAGLSFEDNMFSELQRTYGGHPYLIRIACSEVWRANKTLSADGVIPIGSKAFASVRASIRSRLAQPIKDILLSLVWWYPDEYGLLQILASGDTDFVQAYMESDPDSLLQFAHYGLLRPEEGEFAIADILDFLREFGEDYKKEISPFCGTDIRPELLPAVPDIKKLAALFEMKTSLEIKLRRLIILYLGVRFSFNPEKMSRAMAKSLTKRQDRPDPEALFVGRNPQSVIDELYTLDLKVIIRGNWDVFRNVFDDNKARFEMNMDTVNIARQSDSHTKAVTNEEFQAFENSYNWLLLRLKNIPLDSP